MKSSSLLVTALVTALTMTALVAGVGLPAGSATSGQVRSETAVANGVAQTNAEPLPRLPLGGRTIYPGHILVAFYGTAGTAALGVLGEDTPDRITKRLRRQARPYGAPNRKVQIVYELIVTIADPHAGPDGDYSHDISRDKVRRFVDAAKRNKALLVLDIQPGRSSFLKVAKRWGWALRHPWVGLALDPEWRMSRGQVPGRTIGQVSAWEVNQVSRWLNRLTLSRRNPQKVFVVHQFRRDMVLGIDEVKPRARLAMVQHVDGFGTRRQKLATYRNVAKPDQFHMGFKLFYDEDVNMFRPPGVLRIRPRVEFVSYQ